MKEKVYLVGCDNYNSDIVKESVQKLFSSMGGIEKFINPEDRVFLKINLLMKKNPDDATTTHPAIVEEVVRQVQQIGAKVIIGDSPGGPYTEANLKTIYDATGMTDVASKTGCELNFDFSSKKMENNGVVSNNLEIISPVLNCDKVIAIGKLKTHMLMTATMAIKLCFGYIPGLIKREYHLRMPKPKDFANLLIDIFEVRKPDLNILDAVYGMEGDGPSAGTPIKVGCLIASPNGYALDTVGASIMSIPPQSIPTINEAKERNLFSGKLSDIKIIGDELHYYIKKFKYPKIRKIDKYIDMSPKFIKNLIQPKPMFSKKLCVGCGHCVRACPAKTIEIKDNKAILNIDKCIRCYCCHELCGYKAIDIKKSFFGKILSKY